MRDITLTKDEKMLYLATELQGVKAVALDRDATNSKYYDLSIVAEC